MSSAGQFAADAAVPVRKKKPGFIKRWFSRMATEAWNDARNEVRTMPDVIEKSHNTLDSNKCIRFTVYPASGGRVVEIQKRINSNSNRAIHVNDDNQTSLYIITHEQDFGREIDKIITMEALK